MKHGSLPGGMIMLKLDRNGFIQNVHITIAEGLFGQNSLQKK